MQYYKRVADWLTSDKVTAADRVMTNNWDGQTGNSTRRYVYSLSSASSAAATEIYSDSPGSTMTKRLARTHRPLRPHRLACTKQLYKLPFCMRWKIMARRCGVGVFIIFIDTGPKHDAVSIYKLLAARYTCRRTYVFPRILSSFFFSSATSGARWTELNYIRPHGRK